MKQASKRIFAIVLVVGIAIHFFLIASYCLPNTIKPQKLNVISNIYAYPVFNQNWCLFVPPPAAQNRIFVRYQTPEGYSNWVDILEQEIIAHKSHPLKGYESVYLLLSNSLIFEFGPLMEANTRIYDKKPNNIEFEVLNFEISKYLKLKYGLSSKRSYELLLVSSDKISMDAFYIKSLIIN